MPNTTTVDLGAHALEITDDGNILIASHPQSGEIPIREVVQLSDEETYRLYAALHTRYQQREALEKARAEWRIYCNLSTPQLPWIDRMCCTGCGREHIVAQLSDSGRCDTCRRLAVTR